jgi:hypothetical protein
LEGLGLGWCLHSMCMLPVTLQQVKPNPPTKPQWPRPVRHRMIQLASVIDYAIEVCRDLAAASCSLV